MAVADFFGLALRARVKSADHALQFGEFLDQFGGEVGFAELGGALGVGVTAEFLHKCDNALGLFEIGAELRLERDVGKILHAVVRAFF